MPLGVHPGIRRGYGHDAPGLRFHRLPLHLLRRHRGKARLRGCEAQALPADHEKFGVPEDDLGFKQGHVYRLSNPGETYHLFPHLIGQGGQRDRLRPLLRACTTALFSTFSLWRSRWIWRWEPSALWITLAVSDAGVIVNPLPLRNQMQSFFAGIDIACMEETVWDPTTTAC